jgi:hypothetical protein
MLSERSKVEGFNRLTPQLYIGLIYQITIFYLLRAIRSEIEHDLDEACCKNFVFGKNSGIRFAYKITLYIIF